jgi:hypothetical protein
LFSEQPDQTARKKLRDSGTPRRTEPFSPKLTRDEAIQLVRKYSFSEGDQPLASGTAIRNGDFRRVHLAAIFEWKTGGRGRSRLRLNSDLEIRDALRSATSAEAPRAALAVLTGLSGVQVPVASAIMTMIEPTIFTIIDFRALEALGNLTKDRSTGFYLIYLRYCLKLAKEWDMSIRQLDRSLWYWSREREPTVVAFAT